ncbi:MAG: serine hydrolase domain-containing protein [Myxococcota bacterium]
MTTIHGSCDPAFEAVRTEFARGFDEYPDDLVRGEIGAAVAVSIAGRPVIDQGRLDLDAPVARYWPEFAIDGKADITVHMLLSHRAGLAAAREPLAPEDIYDWKRLAKALAAERGADPSHNGTHAGALSARRAG